MALFRRKADPISDRARALNAEIAALESEIKRLNSNLEQNGHTSRPRSHAGNGHSAPEPPPAPKPRAHEPIFESVDQNRLKARGENGAPSAHYNELGVRKYDLPALLRRIRDQFRGPSTTNPKLVNYLAAGGIQGLRPMRYEKRVARNRFIVLVVFLFIILLGIILAFAHQH